MNFINRAWKNVTRKKSKSILLILTFLLIGSLVIIGLGVSNASENAKILTRQKMRAVVNYTIDYDKVREYIDSLSDEDEINEFYKNYPKIKASDVLEILKDDRVKTANALYSNQVYKVDDGIDFVHLGNTVEENLSDSYSEWNVDGEEVIYNYTQPSFFVKGNYFPNMIEFADGEYDLVEGRFYNQEEIDNSDKVVLISSALAEYNNLSLGDIVSISVYDTGYVNGMNIDENLTRLDLKVIGIYEHHSPITRDSSNFDYTYPYENLDNMLLLPATTMNAVSVEYEQIMFDYYATLYPEEEYYQNSENRPTLENNSYIYNCTLLLNDPLEVDDFVEEYASQLPAFMIMDADNEEFEKLSKPLDTLSLYAKFIVWLVVINAIVIITLVVALTLKTREYEIGVLLSIGTSKLKVIGQFFLELAIVAIIGFTLSIGTGSIIAKKIGNTVLEYQIVSSGLSEEEEGYSWDDYESIWNEDYATDISLDDLISEYEVSISPIIIAEIYALGLGIVLVSVLIPSIMIMRYNPKKILMNQN